LSLTFGELDQFVRILCQVRCGRKPPLQPDVKTKMAVVRT
jgi:hypothetical protein